MGANGVFTPPLGYWRKIRDICDRHGILLIADEVLSGFGRTGRWFAVDHDGVTPDLMTMAKGITGGYAPGGAVIVTDRVARHFDDHVLVCGLTSYAHPLVCAAIVAAIETLRDERLVERAAALEPVMRDRLGALAAGRPVVADVRGVGLLWALELCVPVNGARGREPLPAAAMGKLAGALRRRHIHLHKRDNLIYLAPPLVITDGELDEAIAELGAPSTRVCREPRSRPRRQGLRQRRRRAVGAAARRHVDHVGRLRSVRQRRGLHRRDRRQRREEPDHHQQQLRQSGPGAGGAAEEPAGREGHLQLRGRQPGSGRPVPVRQGAGRAGSARDVRRADPRRRRRHRRVLHADRRRHDRRRRERGPRDRRPTLSVRAAAAGRPGDRPCAGDAIGSATCASTGRRAISTR